MEVEVPVGVEIHWKCPQHEFAGRVAYCVYREIGYFVGVEFAPGIRWSQTAYEPEHLLDVNQLLEAAASATAPVPATQK